MANVGDGLLANSGRWTFGDGVADTFDEHVSKSVPLYREGHELICDMSDFFIKENSICYEIGCSTGTLTYKIAEHNKGKKGASFIGIDIEHEMILKAISKKNGNATEETNIDFLVSDVLSAEFQPADLIICYYTVQFIRPSDRQNLINKLYNSLKWGAGLILYEKVRGADARFQDILSILYNDYKLSKGYTPEEIIYKTRSLKGVMEPFSTQANIDLLRRAGFVDINTIQKYLCFEGFLAIK